MNIVDGQEKNTQGIAFLRAIFAPDDIILLRNVETWTEQDNTKRSKIKGTWYVKANEMDEERWASAASHAAMTFSNQFFGVCPRAGAAGYDLACQVRTVRCLWSDIDDCDPTTALDRCRTAGVPEPSIVVSSGHGTHLYWLFAEPYVVVDAYPDPLRTAWVDAGKKRRPIRLDKDGNKVDPASLLCEQARWIQGLQHDIAVKIGGDSTHDLARLLRLPSTFNRKNEAKGTAPVPCELVRLDTERRYTLEDFNQFHPAASTPSTKTGTDRTPGTAGTTDTRSIETLIERCRTTPVGGRSDADYALCCEAVWRDVNKDSLWERVQDVGKFAEDGEAYFDRTWRKAWLAVESDPKYQAKLAEQQVTTICTGGGVPEPSGNGKLTKTKPTPQTTDEEFAQWDKQMEAQSKQYTNAPSFTRLVSSAELLAMNLRPEFLVKGVLVKGQPCIIGGRSKAMKTSIAVDLAISLGSGTKFLGKYEVPRPVKVAFWTGESGAPTIRETALRVAKSKGIGLEHCQVSWSFDLPKLCRAEHLAALESVIRAQQLEVIIIDPLYLSLLSAETAGSAGNIFAMGAALEPLSRLAQATGTTIILLHHFKKSGIPDPDNPAALEELSQSGAAEWARQWVLLQRRTPYGSDGRHDLWLRAGGSAGHSLLVAVSVEEGLIDPDTGGGRHWKVVVANRAQAIADDREKKTATKQADKEKKQSELATRVLKVMETKPGGETEKGLREALGSNNTTLKPVLQGLLLCGEIEECEVRKYKATYAGYRLAGHPGQTGQTGQAG